MNRKISLGAAISFMAVVAAITFSITMIFSTGIFNTKVYNVKEREELYKKVAEMDHLIRQNYIGELDENTLMDGFSVGMIEGTGDRYAAYYDAETTSRRQAIADGELVGIGAEFSYDESKYVRINRVFEGSPADAAGLEAGDLLVKIDGSDVGTISYEEALDKLMGDPGTKVAITYRRSGTDAECEILRKTFKLPVVHLEMQEGNAYVRITEFNAAAEKQFLSVMNEIVEKEATGVVFDLRGTYGSNLESACEMVDLLVPAGDLLSVTYKNGKTELLKGSDANDIDLPMVVLVNSKTRYAAELFTANLHDYEKAKLVGTTTAGHGVMQTTYNLKDGSSIVMSNASYISAISANYNGVGILPDYEVFLSTDAEKLLNYGILDESEDLQLQKAVEVLETSK